MSAHLRVVGSDSGGPKAPEPEDQIRISLQHLSLVATKTGVFLEPLPGIDPKSKAGAEALGEMIKIAVVLGGLAEPSGRVEVQVDHHSLTDILRGSKIDPVVFRRDRRFEP